MSAIAYDQVRTLYRTMLVYATVGVLILIAGLVEFVYFERPGQASGVQARVVGIVAYDSATGQVSGPDRSEFPRAQQFAAVVDWSSLPDNITVDAKWFDAFGDIVGHVDPGMPSRLAAHGIVPVVVPPGFHHSLPGRYEFVVERVKDGVPVEVLARRFVVVQRT